MLLISRNLPPLRGGIERLMHEVVRTLAPECDLRVVGPTGVRAFLPDEVTFAECPTLPLSDFLTSGAIAARTMVSARTPDLIVSANATTAKIGRDLGFEFDRPFCCFLHGKELRLFDNPQWPGMREALSSHHLLLCNSNFTLNLAINSGLDRRRLVVLQPGIGPLSSGPVKSQFLAQLIDQVGSPASHIVLFVGRLIARKGLFEFIDRCFADILTCFPNAVLVVIGSEPKNSIFIERGYLQKIMERVCAPRLSERVAFFPDADDELVCSAYCSSDVLIMPAVDCENDAEGFGMVALEAAYYGLPTVAFCVGGIPEAVVDGLTGRLVNNSDYPAFTEAVIRELRGGAEALDAESCKRHALTRSWTTFGQQLRSVLWQVAVDCGNVDGSPIE